MKQILPAIIALLLVLMLSNSITFTVPEYRQALVLQFGKVVRTAADPGLHWKLPFIQDVKYFEKRILQWDGKRGEIVTRDKKYVWVDTTARWKIHDPLKFYREVNNVMNASNIIGDFINGARAR